MAEDKNNNPVPDSQILDLDELVPDRPQVKFPGGSLYDLTVPTDLGILEFKQVQKLSERLGGFQGKEEDLSDDELATVKDALDALAALLVRNAPQEDRDRLNDWQKVAIVRRFQSMLPDPTKAEAGDPGPLSTTGS